MSINKRFLWTDKHFHYRNLATAGFYRNNGIRLVTVDGIQLSLDSDAVYQESAFHQLHAEQIKRRINACDKIIFRICNTKLMKKVLIDTVLYELNRHAIRLCRTAVTYGKQTDHSEIRYACSVSLGSPKRKTCNSA